MTSEVKRGAEEDFLGVERLDMILRQEVYIKMAEHLDTGFRRVVPKAGTVDSPVAQQFVDNADTSVVARESCLEGVA